MATKCQECQDCQECQECQYHCAPGSSQRGSAEAKANGGCSRHPRAGQSLLIFQMSSSGTCIATHLPDNSGAADGSGIEAAAGADLCVLKTFCKKSSFTMHAPRWLLRRVRLICCSRGRNWRSRPVSALEAKPL